MVRRSPVQRLQVERQTCLLRPAINYRGLIALISRDICRHSLQDRGTVADAEMEGTCSVHLAASVRCLTTLRCECTNKIRLYAITSNPERTGIQNKPDLDGT